MYIEKWYEKSWVVILFLIFLFPVGLIMMWVNKYEWENRTKKEISIFGGIAFLFIIFIIIGNINAPKKEAQVTKAPEQVVTQTKDNKLKIYYFNSLSNTGAVGDTIKFSDSINEVGNVEYQLSYEKDSNAVIVQPFSSNNNFEWTASEPGSYIFTLTVKNSTDEVKSDKLYIKIISKDEFNKQVASRTASQNNNSKPNTDSNQKTNVPIVNSYQKGTYKVGVDIAPGEYLLDTSVKTYMQCSKDSTGSLDSMIFNDNIVGNSYVTLNQGEYFEFTNGILYPVSSQPSIVPSNGKYNDGMYKVGQDIPEGEYRVHLVNSAGYVEVASNSKHRLEDIITNDIVTADTYITVKNGQYITLSGVQIQK